MPYSESSIIPYKRMRIDVEGMCPTGQNNLSRRFQELENCESLFGRSYAFYDTQKPILKRRHQWPKDQQLTKHQLNRPPCQKNQLDRKMHSNRTSVKGQLLISIMASSHASNKIQRNKNGCKSNPGAFLEKPSLVEENQRGWSYPKGKEETLPRKKIAISYHIATSEDYKVNRHCNWETISLGNFHAIIIFEERQAQHLFIVESNLSN